MDYNSEDIDLLHFKNSPGKYFAEPLYLCQGRQSRVCTQSNWGVHRGQGRQSGWRTRSWSRPGTSWGRSRWRRGCRLQSALFQSSNKFGPDRWKFSLQSLELVENLQVYTKLNLFHSCQQVYYLEYLVLEQLPEEENIIFKNRKKCLVSLHRFHRCCWY